MLSLIWSKELPRAFNPSCTIKFKMCAQQSTCKSSPSQTKEFCKTSSLFKVLIRASLVDELSKVKENVFFSIPSHAKIHLSSLTTEIQCEVEGSGKNS